MKRLSRIQRWNDAANRAVCALDDLKALQDEYDDWRASMPEQFDDTETVQKLYAVLWLDIDGIISEIDEIQGIELPKGFGRD